MPPVMQVIPIFTIVKQFFFESLKSSVKLSSKVFMDFVHKHLHVSCVFVDIISELFECSAELSGGCQALLPKSTCVNALNEKKKNRL